jgi:hypothetical protein
MRGETKSHKACTELNSILLYLKFILHVKLPKKLVELILFLYFLKPRQFFFGNSGMQWGPFKGYLSTQEIVNRTFFSLKLFREKTWMLGLFDSRAS